MKSAWLRLYISIAVLLVGLAYALPNIPAIGNSALGSILPSARINLGLDLKGGMHLTLGVDVAKALQTTLRDIGQGIRERVATDGLSVLRPRLNTAGELEVIVLKNDEVALIKQVVQDWYPNVEVVSEAPYTGIGTTVGATLLTYNLTAAAKTEAEEFTLDQVVQTIRNRIDQFGVAEPDIRKQSGNQVQVQLPGLTDPERAVQIIGQTAHLEFHLVRDDVDPNSLVLPLGTAHFTMVDSETGESSIILDTESLMTGRDLTNARPSFDENGAAQVSITFNPKGAVNFERITGENIQRRMAIVLDGKVYSAPVIQQKISGGDAVINGRFTVDEANDLAIILRAGSLPAPVSILEERTVGPSLGQESIDSGILAAIVGALAVLIAMPIFYGKAGVIADFLLCGTLMLLLAGLTSFGATLTLPGIAGIVLTIGMAVDANVLIFERIREELKLGANAIEAVKAGFSRASISIIDSNLTTIIAAVILYLFGTGPIRGFAVTLSLGIIASLFTSIFVCRVLFEIWVQRNGGKQISI